MIRYRTGTSFICKGIYHTIFRLSTTFLKNFKNFKNTKTADIYLPLQSLFYNNQKITTQEASR